MSENAFLDTGDKAVRFAGTVELWKNIVISTVLCIVSVVAIVVLLRYHADYAHGDFKVASIKCNAPTTATDCNHGSCSTKTITHCPTIRLDGLPKSFAGDYTLPAKPPAEGGTLKVFYNPEDKSEAFLAQNDAIDEYRNWILLGLVVVCLSSAFAAWFQFSVRNSHLMQRTAAAGGVLNLAMNA